jgi:hypothetical protein
MMQTKMFYCSIEPSIKVPASDIRPTDMLGSVTLSKGKASDVAAFPAEVSKS